MWRDNGEESEADVRLYGVAVGDGEQDRDSGPLSLDRFKYTALWTQFQSF